MIKKLLVRILIEIRQHSQNGCLNNLLYKRGFSFENRNLFPLEFLKLNKKILNMVF